MIKTIRLVRRSSECLRVGDRVCDMWLTNIENLEIGDRVAVDSNGVIVVDEERWGGKRGVTVVGDDSDTEECVAVTVVSGRGAWLYLQQEG